MARRAAASLLAAMRARNWVTGLVLPLVAAIVVGIALVIVVGANSGSGGSAPSGLSAGFPPARDAAADFTGTGVTVDAIAASGVTEMAAGMAAGVPALWRSVNGGSTWARAAGTTPTALRRAGKNQLTGVAHGAAGWLAVGGGTTTTAATSPATATTAPVTSAAPPVVVGSPSGKAWTATDGEAAFTGPGLVTSAVAAGPAGYVIVGRQVSGGRTTAAAWYASGLTGWRRAAGARAGALDGSGARQMNAVTATANGFAAVGSAGARPAAWLSANGHTWSAVALPLPGDAASATLRYVAANGNTVVAAGTATTPAGAREPFAAVSANGGASWSQTLLPEPRGGAALVTALTAATSGFTAIGTYGPRGDKDVVLWLLPDNASAADQPRSASRAGSAAGWMLATPRGVGLAGAGTQAITALTGVGATLTGIGFTATAAGTNPTLWQSPART